MYTLHLNRYRTNDSNKTTGCTFILAINLFLVSALKPNAAQSDVLLMVKVNLSIKYVHIFTLGDFGSALSFFPYLEIYETLFLNNSVTDQSG